MRKYRSVISNIFQVTEKFNIKTGLPDFIIFDIVKHSLVKS